MPESLLHTKLFVPPPRSGIVARPHLIERLNQGLQLGHKLTLISAPAGFGKTTLAAEWSQGIGEAASPTAVAWLSLDQSDSDLARFLTYLVAALGQEERIDSDFGKGLLAILQTPQSAPAEAILIPLINEMSTIHQEVILVLDDYHVVDAQPVHDALAFLLENLPPQVHLVIVTRADPPLPFARLRARGQLTEIRAADLRFTSSETADFLNRVMSLALTEADVVALEARTEGWITGLQLAAISMSGSKEPADFIRSFTGSHRYVLDYLIEEVLEQQIPSTQKFLLQTAILDRLCGPLCDTLTGQNDGQQTLEMLEKANLFILPLDNQRQWYRYHHLFADLLRQRLRQSSVSSAVSEPGDVTALHVQASVWYEENGLQLEAFHHAAAADDIERAERLIEGDGTPLYFRGLVNPILTWLASLPTSALDARPALWLVYAMTELTSGHTAGVEEKLQAAETALEGAEKEGKTRDLIGRIANARANLAVGHRQTDIIITQSRRALEYLHPDNMTYRTAATWKLGAAYEFQGDRVAARLAFSEAIAASRVTGNVYIQILAKTGLGNIQLADNQLHEAAETYEDVLELASDLPIPVTVHVHLCLARIYYEWNDLDTAARHGKASLLEAEPYREQYDIHVAGQLFMARLKLAQGDVPGAAAIVAEAEQSARRHGFDQQLAEATTVRIVTLLHQRDVPGAADLANTQYRPVSRARVCLALDNPLGALAALEPLRQHAEAKGLADERLEVLALLAIAHQAQGDKGMALQELSEALALAAPGGRIRTFLDEGRPMARLLHEALQLEIAPDYVRQLLAAFALDRPERSRPSKVVISDADLIEPLSERELEILQQIAEGLTNREIARRLYLALNTVKVHTRNIYGKLGVNSRTQAVAKARTLGILQANNASD